MITYFESRAKNKKKRLFCLVSFLNSVRKAVSLYLNQRHVFCLQARNCCVLLLIGMLTHQVSSPTLRQYLNRVSKLKKAGSVKEGIGSINSFQEEDIDVNYSIHLLLTKFQKLKMLMLQIGKESRQYNQLVGLTSDFEHLLRKIADKVNPWEGNKTSNHFQRLEHPIKSPKSPKIKSRSPPSLKFEQMATIDLAMVKEQTPEIFLDPNINASTFGYQKSSLVSSKTKEESQQLPENNLNPEKYEEVIRLSEKKAALKLKLENISSKRFFTGKIQRMESINSTQLEMKMKIKSP